MASEPEIKKGDEVWYSPFYDGFRNGLFLVKCKVTKIYILDGRNPKSPAPGVMPCSELVELQSDYDKKPEGCEGCYVFYEIDEPTGRDVERESIWAFDEFDAEGIQEWLADLRSTVINNLKIDPEYANTEKPSLYAWRFRQIDFIQSTGGNGGFWDSKEENKDWFAIKPVGKDKTC